MARAERPAGAGRDRPQPRPAVLRSGAPLSRTRALLMGTRGTAPGLHAPPVRDPADPGGATGDIHAADQRLSLYSRPIIIHYRA
ncbi:Hypothetical protein HVIM_04560 (plasmid) [Roseomonas mucosa]|nr:Hypothetical protein HVIM_04560 [Roseomonas mucosa]QDD97507.1 Hypothetical protein ADP8_04560 [Roseomonas mucosa]UZO94867.1 Hypothetical protein RMP42_04560 [Roseomonas mucosa]